METCVESLYTLDCGQTEKRRTLDMIRVLKGAVSFSKSKTGEVIHRYNKYDKRALKRQLDMYDRDAERAKCDSDSQKRNVLRKWSLVFERQKKICDSLRRFDDMLVTALDSQCGEKEEEEVFEEDVFEVKGQANSRERRWASDNHTVSKSENIISDNSQSSYQTRMPKLPMATGGFLVQTANFETIPDKDKSLIKHSDNSMMNFDPLAEQTSVREFLEEQKQIQDQLLTRNSLTKLKSTLDREHSFYKLRLKNSLPEEPGQLLEKFEHDRLLTRRASADRHVRCSKKGESHGNNVGELTRRRSLQIGCRSLPQVSSSARHRNSKDFDLKRSKTIHLF